ncbi:LuxR C-terminal-related transcriptional regulator [Actinoplanes sp. Pm04-4]|uniref:LuxR C-terminal-related transcriptional regulator n=1 Tax=Paractinoplanes pyxinae TaxID=2997416 RepID=A0ABT4AQY9_9ACTN|nr:LuxR C-terminal-related transcriptional regulator [Actinoplanes pyxinae]MCY1136664.1 LuxR C-terminal-related transcriptional regulator [Actinoplanes pyxinae]
MTEIVGRGAEAGVLDALLAEVAGRRGATKVLRGEAGIGKSALLEYAVEGARRRGVRVLRVTGVPGEARIPYAGIDHLVRAAAGTSPYRLAIDLLQQLGEPDEPVLLAVEDAHWLDDASWQTLTFLGRRLESDRIGLVLTVRDGEDVDRRLAAAGLPELRLEPLAAADAETLLERTAPGLVPALRARVLDEAAGNPLGLVELGAAAARSGGSALLPSSIPLSTRLERTFGGLVAELPPDTQELLLVAALDDGGDFDEIVAAAAVPAEAVEAAVAARLVTVDEAYELRFRHPLLRSALRQRARPSDRRRVHAALAGVVLSPQRRLWHRASAAPGPDEAMARELFEVALGAAQQNAVAVALAAVGRAVRLSEDPAERGSRQIWACDLAHEQGDAETVRRLLGEIDETALRPGDRARLTWIRGFYLAPEGSAADRLSTYADLIEGMRLDGDPVTAVKAMSEISLAAYYANLTPSVRDRLVAVARALDLPDDDPRRTEILLNVAPVQCGAAELERLRAFANRVDLAPVRRFEMAIAAFSAGALDLSRRLALSAAADLRAQGRIGTLTQALSTAASASAGLGDTRAALPLAAECVALATETGQRSWALGGSLVAGLAEALRGDTDAARARADAAEQALHAVGRLPMLALVQRIRGVAALAEGRASDAFGQLLRIYDPADSAWFPNYQLLTLGHLAEAAVLAGLPDELRPVVTDLEPIAEQSQSPALQVGLAYARAVLTGNYDEALAEDLAAWPFDRAQLQLTYGATLRRQFRVTDCRPLLRAAAGTFEALGATPWAERARAELRAAGEARIRPPSALATLSPQEQQIARLAADGLSNREIGARLFLSPRTVSTHLYRVYPKLNVTSRGELARIFTSSDVGG